MIEYANLIDEISKELQEKGLGINMENGDILDSLLWMDDVCLIHHDLKKLQEILDVTNHVAKKYHIEFGAAKCKVVKIGKGTTSQLTLNETVLEEVKAYKYLGEMINQKGNLEAQIKEIERKTTAAVQNILAETGNKEFKGMKMEAIWKLADAILIPIITYGAEGWDPTQKELTQIQTIFNKAIKSLLYLPPATPNSILMAETGFHSIQGVIDKKRILQAHRVKAEKRYTMIKRVTQSDGSIWKQNTIKIMEKYGLDEEILNLKKDNLNKLIKMKIAEKEAKDIERKQKRNQK